MVYGDSTGLRYRNKESDPMPINIAGGKTLEECVYYRGGGITVYTDNIVKVRTYEGFYDYLLANQRQSEQIMMLPSEEVVKDKEYYDKLVNGLALQYNHQIENAPNVLRIAQVLQDINTPAPINFGCTVFPDGAIWIGEGYSVGTKDKPHCPVDVPSGKLSFITNATSETHSFVVKGLKVSKSGVNNAVRFLFHPLGQFVAENIVLGNVLNLMSSSKFSNVARQSYNPCPYGIRLTNMSESNGFSDSFNQLLSYKASLTEQELKTELAKDIRFRR